MPFWLRRAATKQAQLRFPLGKRRRIQDAAMNWSITSSGMPSPRSSISTEKPSTTRLPTICTGASVRREAPVAFSASSAIMWMVLRDGGPGSAARLRADDPDPAVVHDFGRRTAQHVRIGTGSVQLAPRLVAR